MPARELQERLNSLREQLDRNVPLSDEELASLPQWKHMFKLRCSQAADPEMVRVMRPLREEFQQQYPEMWSED